MPFGHRTSLSMRRFAQSYLAMNILVRSFVAIVFSFGALEAKSCTCPEISVAELAENADYVFHAFAHSANVVRQSDGKIWLEVGVKEVVPVTGGAPEFQYVKTPATSAECGQSITVPEFYWFFTNTEGIFFSCGGTSPTFPIKDGYLKFHAAIQERLIELRKARHPLDEF